jgi:cytochrome b involved in lipid metabolism
MSSQLTNNEASHPKEDNQVVEDSNAGNGDTDWTDRHMNDSTLAPVRKPSSTTSSASPSSTAAATRRSKVALRKGFGLADWHRLVQTSKDLAQLKGQPLRHYTWDEIRQHKSLYDGWMVLKGKVYRISPYLAYHPGGEKIMQRALGTDVTALYNKYHRWVNEEK